MKDKLKLLDILYIYINPDDTLYSILTRSFYIAYLNLDKISKMLNMAGSYGIRLVFNDKFSLPSNLIVDNLQAPIIDNSREEAILVLVLFSPLVNLPTIVSITKSTLIIPSILPPISEQILYRQFRSVVVSPVRSPIRSHVRTSVRSPIKSPV